jgi:hypothetical protein
VVLEPAVGAAPPFFARARNAHALFALYAPGEAFDYPQFFIRWRQQIQY